MQNESDPNGRIEPRLDGELALDNIGFLQRNKPEPASQRLRIATFTAVGAYLASAVVLALANGRGAPEVLGTAVGAVLLVMIRCGWPGGSTTA